MEAVEWIERNAAPDADVVIYAGDFNTESGDLPHRYESLVFVHDLFSHLTFIIKLFPCLSTRVVLLLLFRILTQIGRFDDSRLKFIPTYDAAGNSYRTSADARPIAIDYIMHKSGHNSSR